MAGNGESEGVKRRPPMPDWAAYREQVKEEFAGLGMPEAEAEAEARLKCERMRLRHAWFGERFEAFLDLQERAGEAWLAYMDAHPEIDWESGEAPDVPEPPEEALAQAVYDEVMAAAEEGRWPRHLHFRCV